MLAKCLKFTRDVGTWRVSGAVVINRNGEMTSVSGKVMLEQDYRSVTRHAGGTCTDLPLNKVNVMCAYVNVMCVCAKVNVMCVCVCAYMRTHVTSLRMHGLNIYIECACIHMRAGVCHKGIRDSSCKFSVEK